MDSQLLDIRQVADRCGVHPQTIHQMRYRGDGPPAVRIGRKLKFRPEDIEAWIESRRETPKQAS